MSQDHLIGFRCDGCGRVGYISRKNQKQVERKLEFRKYCNWCRKHTKHKEAKLPLKSAPKKQVVKARPLKAENPVAETPKGSNPKEVKVIAKKTSKISKVKVAKK